MHPIKIEVSYPIIPSSSPTVQDFALLLKSVFHITQPLAFGFQVALPSSKSNTSHHLQKNENTSFQIFLEDSMQTLPIDNRDNVISVKKLDLEFNYSLLNTKMCVIS